MAIPRRISSSELYDNRNLIKQIEDLRDDVAEAGISDIVFTRATERVTLTVETVAGEQKTASFDDRSVTNVTASQSGTVVTLTFHMSDGTGYDANFNASGTGTTITQGPGIIVTGSGVSGYTVKIDPDYVATKAALDSVSGRVTNVETKETQLEGTVADLRTLVNGYNTRITQNENGIQILSNEIGSDTQSGSVKYRLTTLEGQIPSIDTVSFSNDNDHVPSSKLTNDKKLDKPTATPTVGQLLAASATGTEWVNPPAGSVIDTVMSDVSANPVQNKVIKGYVDDADENLQDDIDTIETTIGSDTTAGSIKYRIKQNETAIGDSTATPKTGIYGQLDSKEATANKVTAFQATPDDTHYPSEKLVYDKTQKIEAITVTEQTLTGWTSSGVDVSRCGRVVQVSLVGTASSAVNGTIATGLPKPNDMGLGILVNANLGGTPSQTRVVVDYATGDLAICTSGSSPDPLQCTFTYLTRE